MDLLTRAEREAVAKAAIDKIEEVVNQLCGRKVINVFPADAADAASEIFPPAALEGLDIFLQQMTETNDPVNFIISMKSPLDGTHKTFKVEGTAEPHIPRNIEHRNIQGIDDRIHECSECAHLVEQRNFDNNNRNNPGEHRIFGNNKRTNAGERRNVENNKRNNPPKHGNGQNTKSRRRPRVYRSIITPEAYLRSQRRAQRHMERIAASFALQYSCNSVASPEDVQWNRSDEDRSDEDRDTEKTDASESYPFYLYDHERI